jgi:hypothetical protein
MDLSGQLHDPAALLPGKNRSYQCDRLGGLQNEFGRGVEGKNSQPPPEIEPRSFDRPARSQ